MTSAWDGRSRAPLRAGLAVITALDLAWLVGELRRASGSPAPPGASALMMSFWAHPWLTWASAFVIVVALAAFALGRAPLRSATLALAVLALLAESHAALRGGPHHNVFAVGVALLGWSIGLAWGRGLGGRAREDLAEAGALATLAATYVAAAASKLAARGLDWAEPLTLADLLLSQHRVSDHGVGASLVAAIVAHPGVCQALAVTTLVIQLGAPLMLAGPRARVVAGGSLLAFHLTISRLVGIGYVGNMMLLALFCVPWPWFFPRLLAGLPAAPPVPEPEPIVARRVAVAAMAILVAAVGAAWLLRVTA
jgi:hypothetical protein